MLPVRQRLRDSCAWLVVTTGRTIRPAWDGKTDGGGGGGHDGRATYGQSSSGTLRNDGYVWTYARPSTVFACMRGPPSVAWGRVVPLSEEGIRASSCHAIGVARDLGQRVVGRGDISSGSEVNPVPETQTQSASGEREEQRGEAVGVHWCPSSCHDRIYDPSMHKPASHCNFRLTPSVCSPNIVKSQLKIMHFTHSCRSDGSARESQSSSSHGSYVSSSRPRTIVAQR